MERPLINTAGTFGYDRGHLAGTHTSAMDDSGEDDGAWLFGFVDILTLLVTMLALLLAYTYVPHGPQPGQASGTRSPRAAAQPAPVETALRAQPAVAPPRASPPVPPAVTAAPPRPADAGKTGRAPRAEAAGKTPSGIPVPPAVRNQVTVSGTGGHVNLVIKDDVLFEVGSARLTPGGRAVLGHVAGMLKRLDSPVSVEGHTDNTPIHTARFPSNWELSTARATHVTRFLIGQGVAAGRLRAIGYGDTRPVAGNATAAGRAQNRRVVLVLHVHRGGAAPP